MIVLDFHDNYLRAMSSTPRRSYGKDDVQDFSSDHAYYVKGSMYTRIEVAADYTKHERQSDGMRYLTRTQVQLIRLQSYERLNLKEVTQSSCRRLGEKGTLETSVIHIP